MVAINMILVSVIMIFCLAVEALVPPNESGLSCPSPGCKEPTKPREHVRDFLHPHGPSAKMEDSGNLPLHPDEEPNKAPLEAERAKGDVPTEGNAQIQHAKRDDDTQDWQDWPETQKELVIAVIIDEFYLHMRIAGVEYETSVEEWTALLALTGMQDWLVKESWQSVYQWLIDSKNVLNIVTGGACKMDAQGLFDMPKEWKCKEFCKDWGSC
ncbi:hypothetical protein PV04_09102 [Phialophora macrospora]|uniref:Uncharacterized protein n=1 Tax=Phialophora macrospora TaxID=1851006 RepID=A0A0D2F813_9EURO|nr:hypothetical protein PV04_09102 [Phialophora macrospora]